MISYSRTFRRGCVFLCAGILLSSLLTLPAGAATINLQDKNSTAVVDTAAGMTSWTVNQIEQLELQWFWYRLGDTGPEAPIDTLVLDTAVAYDDDFDPGDEVAELHYRDPNTFTIDLEFTLTGTMDSQANVSEVLTITNLVEDEEADPLELHLFQYSNFDLGGTVIDTFAKIMSANNTVRQHDGSGASVTVEMAAVPVPDHHEVNFASALLGGGLGKLDDGDADDLSDDNGPIGPGDLAWAFQWDLTLEPGASFVLSINKLIEIPAPAAAPVGVWFICMLAGRRSKK